MARKQHQTGSSSLPYTVRVYFKHLSKDWYKEETVRAHSPHKALEKVRKIYKDDILKLEIKK